MIAAAGDDQDGLSQEEEEEEDDDFGESDAQDQGEAGSGSSGEDDQSSFSSEEGEEEREEGSDVPLAADRESENSQEYSDEMYSEGSEEGLSDAAGDEGAGSEDYSTEGDEETGEDEGDGSSGDGDDGERDVFLFVFVGVEGLPCRFMDLTRCHLSRLQWHEIRVRNTAASGVAGCVLRLSVSDIILYIPWSGCPRSSLPTLGSFCSSNLTYCGVTAACRAKRRASELLTLRVYFFVRALLYFFLV